MESIDLTRRRRIELHLALIPVYLWTLFVWTSYAIDISPTGRLDRAGHMKGHDFLHFYVVGEIGRDRQRDALYSFAAHAARTDRLVPEYKHQFQPVHAPQVAMFFAPFAALQYLTALTIWLIVSAATYGICCYALWRALPARSLGAWLMAILALGYPAFYSLIASGQTSAFALAWFTCAYVAMRADRPWLAGAALGMLAYKPTLLLLTPLALLVRRDWRMLAGAAVAATAQFALAAAYFGPGVLVDYGRAAAIAQRNRPFFEVSLELMHSLDSFFKLLVPSSRVALACYAIGSSAVAAVALRVWRSRAHLEPRFAVLLVASILVDPHVYSYELTVLVPALIFAMSEALSSRDRRLLAVAYLVYVLPAFASITAATRIQLSVPAMGVLLWLLTRRATRAAARYE